MPLYTNAGVDADATEIDGDGPLLDQLADVRLAKRGDIGTLIDRDRRRSDRGLIIGIFGLLSSAEVELLAGFRTNNATCIALFIDSSTWLNLPTAAREEADKAHG